MVKVKSIRFSDVSRSLQTLNAAPVTVCTKEGQQRFAPRSLLFTECSWERHFDAADVEYFTVEAKCSGTFTMTIPYADSVWPDWLEFSLEK